MLETKEQITLALSYAGEDLEFDNGTIKGIPGNLVYNVQSFDSPYDVSKQDFDFQVANEDFTAIGLSIGDSFMYSLGSKIYTFKVISFTDDITGWFNLQTNLINISNV